MKVMEAVSLIDVRRGFIEALESFFGRPLEADPVGFLQIYLPPSSSSSSHYIQL